jgi:DNA repair protein RadC
MDSAQESPCLSVASKKEGRRDGRAERGVVVGLEYLKVSMSNLSREEFRLLHLNRSKHLIGGRRRDGHGIITSLLFG